MISKALKKISRTGFYRDQRGATAIEYGLLVALIAIALMGGLTAVYNAMDRSFNEVSVAADAVASERLGDQ